MKEKSESNMNVYSLENKNSKVKKHEFIQNHHLENKKIDLLKDRMLKFHLEHVKSFESFLANKSFKTIRLKCINKARNDLREFFEDEKSVQMLINLLQVCFKIFEEVGTTNLPTVNDLNNLFLENKVEFYKYFDLFFYASCFLIIKVR